MLTTDEVKVATGQCTLWDKGAVPGFGLRINAGGAKSFFLNYWLNGRERRHTIGGWPRWSVSAAREEAKELRKRIDRGEDPAGEKRERRDAPTIQDLMDRYVRDHLPTKCQEPKRIKDEFTMLVEIKEKLGKHTKVADVHHGDIADMHRRISERAPGRANRMLAITSKMFSLSLVPLPGENAPWRHAAQGNPCKGVTRNREEGRERFFSQAELSAIGDALDTYGGKTAADCVRLIMLTGCRPNEAMKAEWSEFDSEPGFWIKPSAHVKQRKTHRLPLSPPALELLARLRKDREGQWVFPGSADHVQRLQHVWAHVRRSAGLGDNARLYDLRHTVASIGAAGGLSLLVIGRLLGHVQARTTQRYAHLADDPVREAANKIGATIAGASKTGAEVVGIKR